MTDTPDVKEHFDLTNHNTMGVSAESRYFVTVSTADQLRQILLDPDYKLVPKLMLGGGSNILFADDFEGMVVHIDVKGKEVVENTNDHILWKIGAGENWHHTVIEAVEHGWGGIENLSLIPGSAGAAPIQNIGAYGVELEQVFHSLEAVNLETGVLKTFTHSDCKFGYRDSIFKGELKGKYVITAVTLKLSKFPVVNTRYHALSEKLMEQGITQPTIKDISDAVIEIRQSKLPDPAKLGNTGSFFKNPVITESDFEDLKNEYPDIPNYPDSEGVKIPAAWLIDQCGWKGKRYGDAGVHKLQALVLVNYGKATGAEIIELAEKIRKSVHKTFGIVLKPEVNIV